MLKKNNDYSKEYYQLNKEKLLRKANEYREENKEKVAEYAKSYRAKNKEKLRLRKRKDKDRYRKQNTTYVRECRQAKAKERDLKAYEEREEKITTSINKYD